MKKLCWLPAALAFFFLASCSNPQGSVLTSQDDTLRSALQEKSNKTIWTKEIEAEKLKIKLNSDINIKNKELVSPQLLNSIKKLQPAVFPQIKDFASLDTSSMNANLYSTITSFCDTLCLGLENLDTFFDNEYFYNFVFFKNDLLQEGKFEKSKDKLFDKYLICQSFEGQELIQVPLRFYREKEILDLSVYLTYHGGYKVIQIEILGWGNAYGESEKTK